jgi:hypothetical protein
MQKVWQMLVNILSRRRRNEGCNDEVDVGKEEKAGDWERGADRWVPVLRISVHGERVEVEVDQTGCDEDVDHC